MGFYGAATAIFAGQHVTLAGVITRGWFFGVFMTVANLTWIRARNARAAEPALQAR